MRNASENSRSNNSEASSEIIKSLSNKIQRRMSFNPKRYRRTSTPQKEPEKTSLISEPFLNKYKGTFQELQRVNRRNKFIGLFYYLAFVVTMIIQYQIERKVIFTSSFLVTVTGGLYFVSGGLSALMVILILVKKRKSTIALSLMYPLFPGRLTQKASRKRELQSFYRLFNFDRRY